MYVNALASSKAINCVRFKYTQHAFAAAYNSTTDSLANCITAKPAFFVHLYAHYGQWNATLREIFKYFGRYHLIEASKPGFKPGADIFKWVLINLVNGELGELIISWHMTEKLNTRLRGQSSYHSSY